MIMIINQNLQSRQSNAEFVFQCLRFDYKEELWNVDPLLWEISSDKKITFDNLWTGTNWKIWKQMNFTMTSRSKMSERHFDIIIDLLDFEWEKSIYVKKLYTSAMLNKRCKKSWIFENKTKNWTFSYKLYYFDLVVFISYNKHKQSIRSIR